MKLRFFHTSDTHGEFPPIEGHADFVVHSGDWFPNRHDNADPWKPGNRAGKPHHEHAFQAAWVDKHASRIKVWVGSRRIIYCPGNHDYYDPTDRLKAEGVEVINLGVKRIWYQDGIPFIGFPYCPANVHPWNYALETAEMEREIGRMEIILAGEGAKEIVIVAHCPPAGILDKSHGTHYGNPQLTEFLAKTDLDIRALLCGHVHYDNAVTLSGSVLVSNAATVVHNIEMTFEDRAYD